MATEILAVTPDLTAQPTGDYPPEKVPVPPDQPVSTIVSQDLTIISNKRRRFRLR
jgi:hypothetical protein